MAERRLKPPVELNLADGNIRENFRKWKRQVEIYLLATGAYSKAEGPTEGHNSALRRTTSNRGLRSI